MHSGRSAWSNLRTYVGTHGVVFPQSGRLFRGFESALILSPDLESVHQGAGYRHKKAAACCAALEIAVQVS
jgi:hypothetical protein